jgi:RimJ/RimL family protein N-acetyltransferase
MNSGIFYLTLNMKHLVLNPHLPAYLQALMRSADEYEKLSGMRVANSIGEFLLAASPDYFERLKAAATPDPWNFGFTVVHTIDNTVVGMCGFTAVPDAAGTVEIGYGIAPDYQGRGYATEIAQALVEFANANGAKKVCAHTLREINASTQVLKKCGFTKVNETTDSEGSLVWRWDRTL